MSPYRLLSVVVPVGRDQADLGRVHMAYRRALDDQGYLLQFLYIIDGPYERSIEALKTLKKRGEPIEILQHGQIMGEATALATGFRHARGELVMTLTDEPQVRPEELGKLLTASAEHDLVMARLHPPEGQQNGHEGEPPLPASYPRRGKFEYLVRLLFGADFGNLRCGVRVLKRTVTDEITLYGNQHHFLPLIAQTHGFTIGEVDVARARGPRRPHVPKLDLALDLLTAYFVIRFVRKPFRFFGGFGFAILAVGGLMTTWLVIARLFLDVPLIDRPALILSSLLVVLGIQILSVGLIGEIITFAYTKEHKDYKVERIVE